VHLDGWASSSIIMRHFGLRGGETRADILVILNDNLKIKILIEKHLIANFH
jgi:hypothetical protein